MFSLTCVVDNHTTSPDLIAEHGLSFWIESADGVVLFDTGQTAEALFNNLTRLELSVDRIDAVVLSHAHYDHTGGLAALLQARSGLPVYAHPDLFQPRYSHRQSGTMSIGLEMGREELNRIADLRLTPNPVELLPGLWTSGEIAERPHAKGTSANLVVRGPEGEWLPDPHTDDQSLVILGEDGTLTLICGCCHAGILNTLAHVQRVFARKVSVVVGGIHLKSADEGEIAHVIRVLNATATGAKYFLNHCTGDRAIELFSRVFSGKVDSFPAGMAIVID
jgi:7,8-dihydropterin-6-yl-methyl-4-(beta-D-ribofuranosyl)aminobenzene 5'-phosphate synthase